MTWLTRILRIVFRSSDAGQAGLDILFDFENLPRRIQRSDWTTVYLEHGDFFVRAIDLETVYVWFKIPKSARVIDRETGRPTGDPVKIPESGTIYYVAEHPLR